MQARCVFLISVAFIPSIVWADAIDDYVKAAMAKDHIPGVCVAVIPPDKEPIVRSYGIANLETQTPFTEKTVFRVASLSKQFCAYAVLSLIKEGKISGSDKLSKFFPKGHADWSKVTIDQMLAHRSGIAEPGTAFSYRDEYTPDQYVEILAKKPLAEEPGKTYRYNNHGYALLGLIVGQVTKSSLEDYVKKHVFTPAGMETARYFKLEDVIPNRGEAYRWVNDTYVRPLMIRPRIFHGSGGILMSMTDMLRYEHTLRKEEALDRDVLLRQRKTYNNANEGYGGGWQVSRPGGKLTMTHTGGTFGFTCAYEREVDAGWTVILFRNSEGGSVIGWARDILKMAKEL